MKNLQDIIFSDITKFLSIIFPKRKFKIAIISYYYPTKNKPTSGVAIYSYSISREFAKLGCDVHVFTSSKRESRVSKHKIENGSLTIHEISIFSKNEEKDPVIRTRINYLDFENKIPKEISKENKKGKFDIINTNGWLTSGVFTAKQFLDLKWIHTFHSVEVNRENLMSYEEKKYINLYDWIERTTKHADHFISVSKALKKEVIKTYKIIPDKISVIPNGINLNIFKPNKNNLRKIYGFNKNQNIIMTVSRFSMEKGLEILIKSIPYILDSNKSTAFLLVLPEEETGFKIDTYLELKRRLNKLINKYKNRIKLIKKPVSQETLSKLYNITDIYVQPSLYESFGITILEAMACGKPIVASRCGGIPSIVLNGYNGLLFKTGDSEDLTRKIFRILDNPDLKKKFEKNSINFAQKYNWDLIGKQTLDLYEKIIG